MDEVIANLIIDNVLQNIKLKAICKELFDNNIISKDKVNDNIQFFLKDKKLILEEIKNLLPKNISEEILENIISSVSKLSK